MHISKKRLKEMKMAWTDEMIETLKKLWDQGVSTGEIGKRLGVTKNSVVGKVHRLKLVGRPSPIKRADGSQPAKKAQEKPKETKAEAKKVKEVLQKEPKKAEKSVKDEPKKVEKLEPIKTKQIEHLKEEIQLMKVKESIEIPPSNRKDGGYTLTELGINSCRWPIGDPKDENFHFCGKKTKMGQTYCEEHSQIAYVKIIKK